MLLIYCTHTCGGVRKRIIKVYTCAISICVSLSVWLWPKLHITTPSMRSRWETRSDISLHKAQRHVSDDLEAQEMQWNQPIPRHEPAGHRETSSDTSHLTNTHWHGTARAKPAAWPVTGEECKPWPVTCRITGFTSAQAELQIVCVLNRGVHSCTIPYLTLATTQNTLATNKNTLSNHSEHLSNHPKHPSNHSEHPSNHSEHPSNHPEHLK